MMKKLFPLLSILSVLILSFINGNAQTQCVSPQPLTIGANDGVCNARTFSSLGPDFDDNAPTPITTVTNTCGALASDNANWYSFTGDGSTVRVKLYNQTSLTRILVFQNQSCGTVMTASQCASYPDDNLPHTIDINTVNGASYLIAIIRQSGSSTLSGAICAYKTSGTPFSPTCDPLVNTQAVPMTVQLNANDCFTKFTNVATTKDQPGNTNDRPVAVSGCDDTQIEYWWGKFTAIATTTKVFLYGKDNDNASLSISNGPCGPSMTSVLCVPSTGSRDIPSYYEVPTVIGQDYYILIKKPMDAGRLCIYSDPPEATKPFCTANMSFENGGTSGWTASYGSYHLVSAPSNNFTWDLPNNGTPAALFAITSGTGKDPNVGMLPVVAPGGGSYSYRIGTVGTAEGAPGVVNGIAGTHAAAAQMQYCFTVSPGNAAFGYKYAVVMDYSAHQAEIQPLFEVFLTVQSTGDTVQCGHNKHWVGDGYSPYRFVGKATNVASQSNGTVFCPWTDVITDLSGFVGQTICATFRVRDCEGGGVTTGPPYQQDLAYGTHWAYAYFDTYCVPMTINTPEFCAGAPSIQICAPAGYKTYSWPAGQPGLSGSPTTQCVTITNPVGGTTYTVNMVSISGCPVTAKVVLKNIPLTKSADTTLCAPITNGIPLTVSITNPTDPPYTFTWSNGLGTGSSVVANPPLGTTPYVVTVRNGSGCTSTDTIRVTVQACAPTVVTTGSTICTGKCATIQATPSGGQPPYTFTWSPNIGNTAGPFNVCPTTNTVYSVTIKDNNGITVSDTALVNVYTPSVSVSPTASVCLGGTVTLTAGGMTGNYSWTPSGTGTSITVTPSISTPYTVTATDANNCSASASTSVTIHPLPIPILSPPQAICKNSSATLTASGGTSYVWNPGGNGSSITVTPANTTTYTLTVTDANNCTATGTTTVTVNPFLTVIMSPDTTICTGASAQISALTPNGVTYSWASGETTPVITVSPTTTTTYSVDVTDNNGCKGSGTVTVFVNPLPVIGATAVKPSICIGESSTLSATGGVSYSWDPIGITGTSTIVTPAQPGSYTYTVTGTDANGCKSTANTTLVVNPLPTPTISAPQSVCTSTPTTLTAGGGVSYSWSPVNMTGPSITITPTASGNYTVLVTDINGCTNNISTSVTVNPFLTVNVNPATICDGQNTTLIANSSGATIYNWSTGATTQTITVSPNVTTTYSVDVSNNFGCNGSTTVTVTVNPLPTVNVSPVAVICIGQGTTLTASGGSTYNWTSSSGGTFTGNSITVNPTSSTSYNLIVTDANGCSNTGSTSVTVNPLPTVTISPAAAFCQGGSIQLTAGGGTNYLWTPGGLAGSAISVSPTSNTTYTVDVTDINGCKGSNSVSVTIYPAPSADAGPDLDICIGQTAQLKPGNVSGLWNYTWSPPTFLNNPNIPNPVFQGPNTTTYTLTVSATNSNCPPANDSVTVTVHPVPYIIASSDTVVFAGSPVQLYANAAGSVTWYPPTGLSCTTCSSPITTPLQTTTYIVTTVDAYGCRNRDTVTIYVEDILTLYVPNAFTPYGGQNPVFYAYGVGIYNFEFYIFNRWGEMIFETHDPYTGWDGRFKSEPVQNDVYVYYAKAVSITGKSITRTGSVTVLR